MTAPIPSRLSDISTQKYDTYVQEKQKSIEREIEPYRVNSKPITLFERVVHFVKTFERVTRGDVTKSLQSIFAKLQTFPNVTAAQKSFVRAQIEIFKDLIPQLKKSPGATEDTQRRIVEMEDGLRQLENRDNKYHTPEAAFKYSQDYSTSKDSKGSSFNQDRQIKWARIAAQGGHLEAMKTLGQIFTDREDEPSRKEGFEWFLKAAHAGDADAIRQVARCYHNGIGVEENTTKAQEWMVELEKSGN